MPLHDNSWRFGFNIMRSQTVQLSRLEAAGYEPADEFGRDSIDRRAPAPRCLGDICGEPTWPTSSGMSRYYFRFFPFIPHRRAPHPNFISFRRVAVVVRNGPRTSLLQGG